VKLGKVLGKMVVKNVKNHQQWDLKDPQIIYIPFGNLT
jgi:hypothetical protein